KTIQISNFLLIIATCLVVFVDNETIFWFAGVLVGFSSGPNQSSSRSLMSRFSPEKKQNEFFGFFAFSGKITAFLGPFLLAQVTYIALTYFDFSGVAAQRLGVSVVLVLLLLGSYILHFVDENEEIN
ncbi:MAG: MFS transporter, partial [Candidatus Marinimicrobia bacterium]|nr:MFS transporter [Candidatus Neomarinimicrobiota bacterium]